jgi:hypothetical protein
MKNPGESSEEGSVYQELVDNKDTGIQYQHRVN